jgi:hypothetical protein
VFLDQSRATLEIHHQRFVQLRNSSVALITPDLTLLVDTPSVLVFQGNNNPMLLLLNRQVCDDLAWTHPTHSLFFAHIADAAQHVDRSRPHVYWSELNFSKVMTALMLPPELHQSVLDSSFFAPLQSIRNKMTHMDSKVINIRCQRREFADVLKDYMTPPPEGPIQPQHPTVLTNKSTGKISKANSRRMRSAAKKLQEDERRRKESYEFNHQIRCQLLCSLLGNYDHIEPRSRPRGRARKLLYQVILDHRNPFVTEWMIPNVEFLVLNALREYMIHAIRYDPSMLESLGELMQFPKFTQITNDTMNAVRSYFRDYLEIPASALYRMMITDPNMMSEFMLEECQKRVASDLNYILEHGKQRMLKVNYRRPALHMFTTLLGLRKQVPLVTIDHREADEKTMRELMIIEEDVGEEEDEKKRSQEERQFSQMLVMAASTKSSRMLSRAALMKVVAQIMPGQLGKNKNKNNKTGSSTGAQFCSYRLNHKWFLTNDQYTALREVVYIENPLLPLCLDRVLDKWIHFFGIEQDTIDFAKTIFQHFHVGSKSIEKLKDHLDMLHVGDPHCYNLLQFASQIIRDATRHFFTVDLPAHIVENQIAALNHRTKYNLKNTLYPSSIHFVFCSVCNRVYSLLRDFDTLRYQTYRFGLRDVVYEYSTDLMYCRRHKTTDRGKCDDHPLSQLNLLGKMLMWSGKMIMICPQPQCGSKMVLDPDRCKYTEFGPSCCDCTLKLDEYSPFYKDLMKSYAQREKRCVLCPAVLVSFNSCYLYPRDTFLCRKHHFIKLRNVFSEWWSSLPNQDEMTQEDVVKKMVQLRDDFRQAHQERKKEQYKRQLARHKQRTRSRQRGGGGS